MAKEIERKFLVKNLSFKDKAIGVLYRQGYLCEKPTVRVRTVGDKGFITIKGLTTGISRSEYEYEIPLKDAEEMLNDLCSKPIIEKYRYKLEYHGFIWEIDEFLKENQGLIVAEIELKTENQIFNKPDFIGEEVSHDPRYRNSMLVKKPYQSW